MGLVHGEEKAQTTLSGLIKEKFGVTPLVPGYMEEMILEGHQVAQTVQHEALAHPRIIWDFLSGEVERKWGMFKGKLADVEQSPWVQQPELQDALAKMDYALTRLLSRMCPSYGARPWGRALPRFTGCPGRPLTEGPPRR